jgi:membrane protease YdiL (CAAX protease family)
MGRTTEAALVAIFAAVIAVPAAVVFVYAVAGPQAPGTEVEIMAALILVGVASAFVAARLIGAPLVCWSFSPRMRGEKLGRYRAPAMMASVAFQGMARMRPAAWRVPGGHHGQQGDAPGWMAQSAGQ